jgi:hypothetical protein
MIPIKVNAEAKADLTPAVKGATSFLGRLLGKAADEAGLMIAESVGYVRFCNQLRILNRAEKMLEEAGIEPKKVDLKFLAPFLEKCSLEDDPDLSERWAALLAYTATTGDKRNAIFPGILAEMSSADAKVLEWAEARSKMELDSTFGIPRRGVNFEDFGSWANFQLSLDNLRRLGLIVGPGVDVGFDGNPPRPYNFPSLAKAFLKACRGEKKAR